MAGGTQAVAATSTQIVGAEGGSIRHSTWFQNKGSAAIHLAVGEAATTSHPSLAAGESIVLHTRSAVNGIVASGSENMAYLEDI